MTQEQVHKGGAFALDLSAYPAVYVANRMIAGAVTMGLLGVFFTVLGVFTGVAVARSRQLEALPAALILVALGVACLLGVVAQMLQRKRIVFGRDGVEVEATSPIRRIRWSEPYAGFQGVCRRIHTISGKSGSASFWRVELVHPDARRNLILLDKRIGKDVPSSDVQTALEEYARLLSLPIVPPSPGGLQRWLRRFGPIYRRLDDPWPLAWNPGVRHRALGPGSTLPFREYLERESRVSIGTVEELTTWLAGCQYVRDTDLFDTNDHWQHPCDFEEKRKGDCEDHALWAWRRLIEIGFETRFCVGLWTGRNEAGTRRPAAGLHAWVTYRDRDAEYLLETTTKDHLEIRGPLDGRRSDYFPYFSVGRDCKVRTHRGYAARMVGWRWSNETGA